MSRVHFVIEREEASSAEEEDHDVYIIDKSTNGTFINDDPQPIGKGQKRPLVNRDVICVSNSTRKAFKFQLYEAANRSLNDSTSGTYGGQVNNRIC